VLQASPQVGVCRELGSAPRIGLEDATVSRWPGAARFSDGSACPVEIIFSGVGLRA